MKVTSLCKHQPWVAVVIIFVILFGFYPATGHVQATSATGTVYYVDNLAGDDSNTGTGEESPWKTLNKINETTFQPGDQILLKAGGVWENQTLAPKGSGIADHPIVIDKYGIGDKPKIQTNGSYSDAVTLNDQQYWELHNLDVSNTALVTGTFAESLSDYRGIHVTGSDAGTLQYFRIRAVDVHDVSGEIAWISGTVPETPEPGIRFKTGWDGSKKTGGIVFDTTVTDPLNPLQATVFNDVVIEDSTVKNTSFGGIIFKQYAGDANGNVNVGWGTRESETDSKFTPHTNITIRNNFITQKGTDYGCNAMYLTGVKGALVEHNVVDGAGTSGIETYYADDITIQYNEVFNTTKKAGGADSNGIDPDKGTTQILIQYNYVHDNGDGILICQFSFGDTIIRYNVLESNSRYPIYLHSDKKAVAEVYNNTIYNDCSNYLIYGYGTSLLATYTIRNNILYTTKAVQELTTSPTITYDNNSYYTSIGTLASPADDLHAFTGNPQLVSPGTGTSGSIAGGTALDSLTGYQLKRSSMLINRGLDIINTTTEEFKDFAGRVLYNGVADLGAFEYYDDSQTSATLAGRVTNSAGNGMSGVVVSDTAGSSLNTTTDSSGYYVMENVPVDSVINLKATKNGYSDNETGIFTVSAGNVMTRDIGLVSNAATGSISGKVWDGDLAPAGGVTVTLSMESAVVLSTVTDAAGLYTFPAVEIGENYSITAAKEGYRNANVSGIQVEPALATSVPDLYVVNKQFVQVNASNFNDLATGAPPASPWMVTTSGGSVGTIEIPSASDKSIKLTRSTNSGNTSMSQTFAQGTLKGVVTITADLMKLDSAGTTNWISLPYVYSSAGTASSNVGVSLAFAKGQIVAYIGGTSTNIMPYEQNKWYNLRLVMNTGSGKYDLYIDNVLVVEQAAFRNKIADIGRIDYYANSSNYGTAYIDNVKLYRGIPYERNDAAMESLTADIGSLVKQNAQSYSLDVPYFMDSIQLTATANSPNSSLTVNGSETSSGQPAERVMLAEGSNTIPVVITAEDGSITNTVTVTINRTPAALDSTLQGLLIEGSSGEEISLAPEFSYDRDTYTVNVVGSVYGLTVMPLAGAPATEVQVNGVSLVNGQLVTISLRDNVSTIVVTTASGDGTDYRTYTITVNWEGANDPGDSESVDSSVNPLSTIFDKNPAYSTDIAFDVQLNGNSLSEIRNGDQRLSNENYTVTDSVYHIESSYLNEQPIGITSLTFDFNQGKDVVIDIQIKDSSSNGDTDNGGETDTGGDTDTGGSNTGANSISPVTVNVSPVTITNGKITVNPQQTAGTATARFTLTQANLTEALSFNNTNQGGINQLTILVNPVEGVTTYEVSLPTAALSAYVNNQTYVVQTPFATVELSSNMLTQEQAAKGTTVMLRINSATDSSLFPKIAVLGSGRPIIDLSIRIDGEDIKWNNNSMPVQVKIPYTLTIREILNSEYLTVWYIDGTGQTHPITSGKYDDTLGMVTFRAKHFSTYAVVMAPKTFSDLGELDWARKPVEVLASKGILNGLSSDSYAPATQTSRADYVMMLVKTLGLSTDIESSGFMDVLPGSYYYDAINTAKTLGIVNGDVNGMFAPKDHISRQEMIVMTERALRLTGGLSSGAAEGLSGSETIGTNSNIKDLADVADYAAEAVGHMVQAGWVKGYNSMIYPERTASRAEAAVLLYNIYKNVI